MKTGNKDMRVTVCLLQAAGGEPRAGVSCSGGGGRECHAGANGSARGLIGDQGGRDGGAASQPGAFQRQASLSFQYGKTLHAGPTCHEGRGGAAELGKKILPPATAMQHTLNIVTCIRKCQCGFPRVPW